MSRSYSTRNANNVPQFRFNYNFFKNSFFPSVIAEWNNLDLGIRNSESINIFKKSILNFIRPIPNSTFNCHNPRGIKFITRLRLGLSHLREHKFKNSFQDCLNPFCDCGNGEIETSSHYLLHCPNYTNERSVLLNKIRQIDSKILEKNDCMITQILLFGDQAFNDNVNTAILNATMDYLTSSKRFDNPLFENT